MIRSGATGVGNSGSCSTLVTLPVATSGHYTDVHYTAYGYVCLLRRLFVSLSFPGHTHVY